jgi:broad specificity phosphatase PhoE
MEGKVQGWLDSPLSELGHYHANRLADRLAAEFEISKIFTSPLTRAVETASYLAQNLGLSLIYNEFLKERNLGPLSGLTKQEIKIKFPEVEYAWSNNLPRPPLIGVESDEAFTRRVQAAINTILLDTEPKSTAAVISHGGTLNQMLKNWLKINDVGSLTFSFNNTSLTIVEVHETFVRLVSLNDISHLGVFYAQRPPAYAQSSNTR